jgi:predicted transcriptional regulator
MKKLSLFFFLFLLPNTLLGYDYFLSANCTSLVSVSGDVDTSRLSACFSDLINGINDTRRTLDDKNNQTQEKIVKVDSTVDVMQRTVRDLVNDSGERKEPGKVPDQVMNSLFEQMKKEIEEHNKETDLKIKQLEEKISALEALLSNFTDEVKSSKQEANK